jgi:hypothetical protein
MPLTSATSPVPDVVRVATVLLAISLKDKTADNTSASV